MSKTTKYQIISTISIVLVAVLGSVFVNIGMEWFNSLAKPSQWISNIIIPIVWSVIYLLAIICNIILIKQEKINKTLLTCLILNGIFNILWCLVFFTLNLTFIGLITIIINLILGWFLWINLQKTENLLAKILIIYPIWLSIATTLNLALWILN